MIDTDLLFKILKIQSHSRECEDMLHFLYDYCTGKGYSIDFDESYNLYVTKGTSDSFPCVVAHVDTVHAITKGGIAVAQYAEAPHIVFGMNPETDQLTGIGGDDKCGIYVALKCLENLPFCKSAFFVDEEIGCVGSSKANLDFFKDCRYILQADRRGNDDFVNNICGGMSSKEFQDAVLPIITKYGYKFAHGMMTDVMQLRDNDVGISCANMSAGYYNPHQKSEYINLDDLDNVTNMCLHICEELVNTYPYIHTKSSYYGGGWDMEDFDGYYMPRRHTYYPSHRRDDSDNYERFWQNRAFENDDKDSMKFLTNGEHDEEDIHTVDESSVDCRTIKKISEMTDEEFSEWERQNALEEEPENPLVK